MTKYSTIELGQDDDFVDLGEASLETEGQGSVDIENPMVPTFLHDA